LNWIYSKDDFKDRHTTLSNERVPNSGTWFLQSELYQNWVKGTTSNVLCCQGMRKFPEALRADFGMKPGPGKRSLREIP
jgi:hypothetical protein